MAQRQDGEPLKQKLSILYTHQDFVVVDKPAGILVHSNPRFPNEYPLVQRLRNQLGQHVYPVHRLDRQTSGCLIFALRSEPVSSLAQSLKEGKKSYWAFVRGAFPYDDDVIVESPIKTKRGNYLPAKSTVRCIARCTEPRSSILSVEPSTGRRHQVRRHVRDLHHPILHDGDHGDSRVNRMWKKQFGLSRLALHCYSITLCYQEKVMSFFSPLHGDLADVFRKIPWWEEAVLREPRLEIKSL